MECKVGDCGYRQYREGFCYRHWLTWNQAQPCAVDDCEKPRKGMQEKCERHYRDDLAEKNTQTRPCEYPGCTRPSVANNLCDGHRKRLERFGDLESRRPADWGAKEKHPLTQTYRHARQRTIEGVTAEWQDFWKFVEDVGERPSSRHSLRRYRVKEPFGPENWYWHERGNTDKDRNAHMRKYRKDNPLAFKERDLKRDFGIGMDDYMTMLELQGGGCAICGGKENGRYKYLAVDHCHDSKKIRGLLCGNCNTAIGLLKDDVTVLRKAIEYLSKN